MLSSESIFIFDILKAVLTDNSSFCSLDICFCPSFIASYLSIPHSGNDDWNCPNIGKSFDEEFSFFKDVDWEVIGRELFAQTVAALPADLIRKNPAVPKIIKKQWENVVYAHIVRWEQILYAQEELIQLMLQHGIPLVILKGVAAAMYYPAPQYRSMGDVDLLVLEKDYRKAFELMLEQGYVLAEPENAEDYHYTLKNHDIVFELHRGLAKLPDDEKSRFLMQQVHNGLEHVEWRSLDGYRVPVLPWLPNGLVLIQHIRQHLRDGLGLRQIIDWMMYADKELDDEKYPQFQAALQQAGLESLAINVTRMCQIYLGLRENGISWCSSADIELCGTLMEYIMEQGNFGRKAGSDGKGTKALSRCENGTQLMAWMQRQGQRHWKAVQKYPFLKHVAFLHELGWYFSWILHRKAPVRAILSDIRSSRRRRRMFRQLMP